MPQRTLSETCTVDESNFNMNGTVSRQNTRRYADRNNLTRNFVYKKTQRQTQMGCLCCTRRQQHDHWPSLSWTLYRQPGLLRTNQWPHCSRSPQVISATAEWGFSQSVVYAGWCSCSPCLTCSQSPARVVWQSCGWNGTSDWLASQKSRSLSIGLLSMGYSQAESLQTIPSCQSSTAVELHHWCLQRDQTHQRGKTCCSIWRQELRGVYIFKEAM